MWQAPPTFARPSTDFVRLHGSRPGRAPIRFVEMATGTRARIQKKEASISKAISICIYMSYIYMDIVSVFVSDSISILLCMYANINTSVCICIYVFYMYPYLNPYFSIYISLYVFVSISLDTSLIRPSAPKKAAVGT